MSEQGQFSAADIDSAPPQQKTGQFSAADIDPPAKTWTQQLADYPKGIWENLVQTGQGMVNLATHPWETAKGTAAAQDAVRLKLVDALKKGDYVTAGRHALEYLIPVAGPGMSESGDLAQRGEVGRALGQATSMGLQMALPGALHANAPAIVPAVERGVAATKGAAQTAGAVGKAAVKAGAPDVAAGAAKAGLGYAASEALPGLGYARYLLTGKPMYEGVQQVGGGLTKGFQAGKAALADRIATALEASKAAEAATKARATAPTPVGLLGSGSATPPAPPDTSYVRSVPAEYPQPEAVPPKGLLGPGPERIITPPGPEDTSFVKSVPAEYPQVEGAAPAAPTPAAPAGPDPALLEGLAQGQIGKSFSKATPAEQSLIRNLASRLDQPVPEQQAAAPARAPLPAAPEPAQPAAPGRTIQQVIQEELAARKAAEAPAANEPSGRPDVESKPLETPPGSTEEPESAPQLESPRSQFNAAGERKSPLLRAAEITAENTKLKAQRFAQAMHGYVSASELQLIPKGRVDPAAIAKGAVPGWGNITDNLIAKGLIDKDEVPPNTSIPQIVSNLREMELAGNKAKLTPSATPVKPGVSAPAPESTQPPAAPSSPLQTPSAGGAEVGQPQTFTGTMADFGRRLNEISKSRDVGALEKTVADMEEYRNSGGPKTDADYKLIGAAIEQGHSTLRQVNAQSGRPAIESKPVQPSPGSTGTSQAESGSTGRAALQGAQQRNVAKTAAKKAKLTPKAAAPAETPPAEQPTSQPAAPSVGKPETLHETMDRMAQNDSAQQQAAYTRNISGTDMAEAPYYGMRSKFWQDIKRGVPFDDAFKNFDTNWRQYAAENNAKVAAAGKIKRGPSSGQSVLGHRWLSPDKVESNIPFLKTMTTPKGPQ